MAHKFYDIKNINMRKLWKFAKDIAYEVRVDVLDCDKSFRRQQTDMSLEDVMKMYKPKCHTVFIHRENPLGEEYIETGFSTMGSPIYFLYININISYLYEFIERYKLKERVK